MTTDSLHAPAILSIAVEGVRLYRDSQRLEIQLDSQISAFVGANGIGKSTLLSLANYAITGLVPSMETDFKSVEEYYSNTQPVAARYFSGRIDEDFRDLAAVEATFRLGATEFWVRRELVSGFGVQEFSSSLTDGSELRRGSQSLVHDGDRDDEYRRSVVVASGFANFEQFTFWQLFLMTFDERRHLLFWDRNTLQGALMIALGRSPNDAVTAEKLRRDIEKQDSLARNARWRATIASRRLDKIVKENEGRQGLSDEEVQALKQKRKEFETQERIAREDLERAEASFGDASREVAERSLDEQRIETEYLRLFAGDPRYRRPAMHSFVRSLIDHSHCELCGARSVSLTEEAQNLVDHDDCPLCGTTTSGDHSSDETELGELGELDQSLADAKSRVDDARSRYQRLRAELQTYSVDWDQANHALNSFLEANADSTIPDADRAAETQAEEREIAGALDAARQHRVSRDEYRRQLEPIIEGLVEAYERVETQFVPAFRALAERFIGRPVDVEFERSGVAVGLRFALDGESRRSASELSESQQFFVDIALRMALIKTFIHGPSTLIVDTPEGSLDIAYETRAGELFDHFATGERRLMMMSNLNSSNLLGVLATRSDGTRMEVFKMTDWALLSDVQLEGKYLFDQVYAHLMGQLQASAEA